PNGGVEEVEERGTSLSLSLFSFSLSLLSLLASSPRERQPLLQGVAENGSKVGWSRRKSCRGPLARMCAIFISMVIPGGRVGGLLCWSLLEVYEASSLQKVTAKHKVHTHKTIRASHMLKSFIFRTSMWEPRFPQQWYQRQVVLYAFSDLLNDYLIFGFFPP
ncbi:hypothetical protein QML37_30310, partial [Klebsiella pneumoniae]|uniref:hypothetical protein n=1 Tax=Klebsiella pneumoniae TaxID=573 RepID=UPI003A806A90